MPHFGSFLRHLLHEPVFATSMLFSFLKIPLFFGLYTYNGTGCMHTLHLAVRNTLIITDVCNAIALAGPSSSFLRKLGNSLAGLRHWWRPLYSSSTQTTIFPSTPGRSWSSSAIWKIEVLVLLSHCVWCNITSSLTMPNSLSIVLKWYLKKPGRSNSCLKSLRVTWPTALGRLQWERLREMDPRWAASVCLPRHEGSDGAGGEVDDLGRGWGWSRVWLHGGGSAAWLALLSLVKMWNALVKFRLIKYM